jgi:AraC family transcriptional activator of pobA
MHTVSALRISFLFNELLAEQFSECPGPPQIMAGISSIKMRHPSDFADALLIHVNHLNRTLKEVTGKTTSALIADRLEEQSCVLLKHSHYTCSEIAFALGFAELPHFINFFKRRMGVTPNAYRREELGVTPGPGAGLSFRVLLPVPSD